MPNEPVLQIGDIVTIRQWDDMVDEYGISLDGNYIPILPTFISSMKQYCGEKHKIKSRMCSDNRASPYFYRLDGLPYAWSIEMFERDITRDTPDPERSSAPISFETLMKGAL